MYLTYEELKRFVAFLMVRIQFQNVVPYLWGIETKRQPDFPYVMLCTKPLYLTYEELKPASWPSCCTLRACCTLPMRNWNILFIFYSYQYEFRCTLPMRNWNRSLVQFQPFQTPALLYLTYEELKHVERSTQRYYS